MRRTRAPTGGAPTGDEPGLGQGAAALERTGVTITEDTNIPAEHYQVGVDANGNPAWPAGRQLLLYRGAVLRGMCTVDAATHTSGVTAIRAHRDVMVERIWESADGALPAAGITWTLPTASSTTTVTVRDQWYAGAPSPAIYERVGRATHEVFDCLNAPAEADAGQVAAFTSSTADAAYATGAGDRCRGWVLDATLTAGTHTWTGGLATCTVGAKAHVDIHRWNTDAASWDRVGGGEVSYTSAGGTCTPSYTAWDDNTIDAAAPTFEPGTDADVAGRYRMVIYGYQPTVAVPHFTAAAALPVQAAVQTAP